MTEVSIKGTVARVEYRVRKLRVLHVLLGDGRTVQVQLSHKMNEALPPNLLGAEVSGVAYESYSPGLLISNWLGIVEPDVQPLLSYERPIIIFDSHEVATNPLMVADMRAFGFDVAESPLIGTGADLVASSRIGIQLKMNLDDLCGSVSDGRLFSEVEELETCYELPMLLIVGTRAEKSHMNAASVEGSLAYLATTFDRLRIIHRPDRPSASLFLKSLVRREQTEGRHYPVLKEWKRGQNLDQAKLAMIGQLPGIGGRLAAQVLREKKTVEAATQMREIDWRKYTSKPRARDIEKVLREPVA